MHIQLEVHLQILLAVGLAVFCFGLVLGCIICWRRRKSRSSDTKEDEFYMQSGPTDHVTLTLSSSPSIKILPVKQQYEELDGDVLDYPSEASSFTPSDDNKGSFPQDSTKLKVPQKSRFALRRLSTPSAPCSPFKPSVHGRASLPSIRKLSLPSKTRRALDRRSTVIGDSLLPGSDPEQMPSIQQVELTASNYSSSLSSRRSSLSTKQTPAVQFSLLYCPADGTLTVTILSVFRGPRRLSSAMVRASLPPLCPAALQAVPSRRNSLSLEPQTQAFTLEVGSVEELRACTLKLAVFGKDFSGLRETPLGELELKCSEVDWEPDTIVTYSRQLNPARRRVKKSHSSQESLGTLRASVCISKPLGQLFVLLQYQTQAHRIKVMVRKAENLAKLTRIPGAADHYVVINLRHGGNVISTKETKGASGPNAVWNAPFLFDLPPGDIIRLPLVLEFIVMQGRLYTKSSVLGRVLIGSEGPEAGQQHWKEMCSRGQVETARWHTLISDTP